MRAVFSVGFVPSGCRLGLELLGFLGIAGMLHADWDPYDPAKWVQPPDLSPLGLDINATFNPSPANQLAFPGRIVADDFLCALTGPITDIHIWGSWLMDRLPVAPVPFHLSIHSDIPAGVGGIPWSRPGPELWSVDLLPTASRLFAHGQEQFYDPQLGLVGSDTEVWQYNFEFEPGAAFVQQAGNTYWLDVQALLAPGLDDDAVFGWKTRDPGTGQFNDDAAWNLTADFGGPLQLLDWAELRYPQGHPLFGHSIDMAFVLTTTSDIPEPGTWGAAGFVAGFTGLMLRWRRRRVIPEG